MKILRFRSTRVVLLALDAVNVYLFTVMAAASDASMSLSDPLLVRLLFSSPPTTIGMGTGL